VLSFIDSAVVEKFFSSKVTGSHVYNTIKMLYLKNSNIRELKDITPEWVVKEIKLELDTLKRIRTTDYLKDTMTGANSSEIGFPMVNSSDDEDEEMSEEVEKVSVSSEIGFKAMEQGPETTYSRREGMSAPSVDNSSFTEEYLSGPTESNI
jgi:hypothetical protein